MGGEVGVVGVRGRRGGSIREVFRGRRGWYFL